MTDFGVLLSEPETSAILALRDMLTNQRTLLYLLTHGVPSARCKVLREPEYTTGT